MVDANISDHGHENDPIKEALGESLDDIMKEGAQALKKEKDRSVKPDQPFDESEFYAKVVWPKMQELGRLCKERGLPHLIWVINACTVGEDGESGTTANGLISEAHHKCAQKMSLLANIADGSLSLDTMGKMMLIQSLVDGKLGGDSK